MVGAFYEAVFGWAWKKPVAELVTINSTDAIATIGGAVIVGLIHYQMYYAKHRPVIQLPGGRRFGIGTISIPDLGGMVLEGLEGNPLAEGALQQSFGLVHGLEPCVLPSKPTREDREHYTVVLHERRDALDALLDRIADQGAPTLVKSYDDQADFYHLLGGCQAGLASVTLAAIIDILAKHLHVFETHLLPSLEVTALCLSLFFGAWQAMMRNRRYAWQRTTSRLRNGLRAWAAEHPETLQRLATDTTPEIYAGDLRTAADAALAARARRFRGARIGEARWTGEQPIEHPSSGEG
jgi:hypothetical protein